MKFDELRINQQVIHRGKKSTIVHLYKNEKIAVVTINDENGKPINLAKVKPQGLKPYFCDDFNKECDAKGLSASAFENPCAECRYKNNKHN